MKTHYEYIHFDRQPQPPGRKTSMWYCLNNRSGDELGEVRWYPTWRMKSGRSRSNAGNIKRDAASMVSAPLVELEDTATHQVAAATHVGSNPTGGTLFRGVRPAGGPGAPPDWF